jgi:hypothetical protein
VLQSKDDYDAAIRAFFLHGAPEEFEAFNAHPPALDQDLAYVPGQGLINPR